MEEDMEATKTVVDAKNNKDTYIEEYVNMISPLWQYSSEEEKREVSKIIAKLSNSEVESGALISDLLPRLNENDFKILFEETFKILKITRQ